MPAPRPIRLTAVEVAVLLDGANCLAHGYEIELSGQPKHPLNTARGKLKAATEPAPKGLNVAPMEAALEAAAPGKVARLLSSGYARASKRAAQLGATVEDVTAIGRWLSPWYRGTVTLLDLFNRWDTWLPKARASAPPKGLPEGLDGGRRTGQGNVGQGASPAGRATPQGRSAPGFR